MNIPFKSFLKSNNLNIAAASRLSGIPYMTIFQHIHGKRGISAESALKYQQTLGIPLSVLRPDLWPPDNPLPSTLQMAADNKEE